MSWWADALFDTCSIITVDKMLVDDPGVASFFPAMRTVEACLLKDNLDPNVAARMWPRLSLEDLPPLDTILKLTSGLPAALSETDKLVYATACHHRRAVVSGDRDLAKALMQAGIHVANVALLLNELVESQTLTPRGCDTILAALDARKDAIIPRPQTWTTLKTYRFP